MNKSNVAQVLGVLCKNPQILQRTDEFQLSPDDFDNILDKYIFSTIFNCFNEGAECLTIIDIDKCLRLSPAAYSVWERNDGANYLTQAIDLGNEGNFTNYYNNLKKANLLRDLNKIGIDTSCIYSTDVFDEDISEKNESFQKMTTQDITEFFKKKLGILEYKYGLSEVETIDMGQKIRGIFSDFETNSVVGAKLMGDYFNTVVGGARKGTLFMMSSTSAGGKTRNAIGNACELAFPVRYNWRTNEWERRYSSDKVLYIATEQDEKEIGSLMLAYLTGINEDKVLYPYKLTDKERKLVQQAIFIIEQYSENFKLVVMPNPSIAKVKSAVRKLYYTNGLDHVFYDYIFSSPALLAEFRDVKVREDVALLLLSTALKELAVELSLWVYTGTQLSNDVMSADGFKDQRFLANAKSLANKADVGCIFLDLSDKEKKAIEQIDFGGKRPPNQIMDIYKLRRGRYMKTRIISYFDKGTCRRDEYFITNEKYGDIEDFELLELESIIEIKENVAKELGMTYLKLEDCNDI